MPEAAMDDSPHSDANIEIRLGRPQQLFNSFDPSPFHERYPYQLDTNSIECCEFSSTAAAILPKYSVSPAGRPTPITTRS
jgi:hypothetical protein